MSLAVDVGKYRRGGLGFINWVEENVRLAIYPEGSDIPIWTAVKNLPEERNPETNRSYKMMWEAQKEIAMECLRMENGRFIYRLLVFCWMRGEGKSLFVCLIQLWKFFNFLNQSIMLGANSKDQVKFVHYDIMRNIILNSPKLLDLIGGKRNIQEKEIRIKDAKGNVVSVVRSISSFSGIVSNITGYTFSEIFDMKNPKFFSQLDGSTRNIPNALGVIDSTVSDKGHILYSKLWKNWQKGVDPYLFFSYRCSPETNYKDFWNPQMTEKQLQSYAVRFLKAEFERYFKNTWEAGSTRLFTDAMVYGTHYVGCDGMLGMGEKVKDKLNKVSKHKATMMRGNIETQPHKIELLQKQINGEIASLIPLNKIYSLTTEQKHPRMATIKDLEKLTNLYKTDWAILAGLDRADPMKAADSKARSILTLIAKGLPNSKNNPELFIEEGNIPNYIYFMLHLAHIEGSDMESIKYVLKQGINEFDGIDMLCSERWGMWDIGGWCEDQDVGFDPVFPSYDKQREAFSELWLLYNTCRFKTPPICVPGQKTNDIFVEETKMFDHNPVKRWYGSQEKDDKFGVQDDSVFATAWTVYGGRNLGVEDFRERKRQEFFGEFFEEKTVGKY